jgi:hypothetical protein
MIKSKNYQHALLKMVSFANDLVDLVNRYRDELTKLNQDLLTPRAITSTERVVCVPDFKLNLKRLFTYQNENDLLLSKKPLKSTSNSPVEFG